MGEVYFVRSGYLWLLLVILPLLFILNYFTYRRKRLTIGSLILWRRLVERIPTRKSSRRRLFSLVLLLFMLSSVSFILALSEPTVRRIKKSRLRLLIVRSAATASYSNDGTVFKDIIEEAKRLTEGKNVIVHTLPPEEGEGKLSPAGVKRFLSRLKVSHLPRPKELPQKGYDLILSDRKEESLIPTAVLPAHSANAGIVSLGAEEFEKKLRLLIRLIWTGERPIDAKLSIEGKGSEIFSQTIRLKNGENIVRLSVEAGVEIYRVSVECNGDTFPIDDFAYISRIQGVVRSVAYLGDEQEDVLRALTASGADVVRCLDEPQEGFRLLLYYRRLPKRLPETGTVVIIAPPDGINGWFSIRKTASRRLVALPDRLFIDPDALSGVKVEAPYEIVAEKNVKQSVYAMDENSSPVISELRKDDLRIIVVGFDVEKSDWHRRASFPVFFALLLRSVLGRTEYLALSVGQPVRVPIEESTAEITSPSNRMFSVRCYGGVLSFIPDEVGIWRIRSSKHSMEVGIGLLCPNESYIIPNQKRSIPPIELKQVETVTPFWEMLVIVALLLLGLAFIKASHS